MVPGHFPEFLALGAEGPNPQPMKSVEVRQAVKACQEAISNAATCTMLERIVSPHGARSTQQARRPITSRPTTHRDRDHNDTYSAV